MLQVAILFFSILLSPPAFAYSEQDLLCEQVREVTGICPVSKNDGIRPACRAHKNAVIRWVMQRALRGTQDPGPQSRAIAAAVDCVNRELGPGAIDSCEGSKTGNCFNRP